MQQVAVVGSGSWGTALAVHLARVGHGVTLWGRDQSLVAEMRARRANPIYLPDIVFPPGLEPAGDLAAVLAGRSVVVMAVPSHGVRATARLMAPHLKRGALIVSAVKGLEERTLLRMTQVLAGELPSASEVAVLSGPSFALEVARSLPTAVVVASSSAATVEHVQAEFRSPWLRLYGTSDVIGVEIGGAMKNTIAIAAGVVEGLGQGHNALAALITRGLAELTRLAVAMGGQRDRKNGG
jgi:glycerol-3-phosphate dehydrogenase (NAD(P)+)